MPSTDWSAKRERQYEHIKTSLKDRGKPTKVAEEIAARSVNKERAQHGDPRPSASRRSTTSPPATAAASARAPAKAAAPMRSCTTRPGTRA